MILILTKINLFTLRNFKYFDIKHLFFLNKIVMFNNHNQDNPQEEDNNQNQVNAWNNNQTIFDISLITTNKGNNTNNLGPAPIDGNADQVYLILDSSHHTPNFGDEFQNYPSITNKEDKIELIEKAPVISQNATRNKRLRGLRNHIRGLINKAAQEKGLKLFPYNGQLENDSTLGHSSNRCKRRKKHLEDASNSNIDQKRFRYKIKKIRNRRKYH
jgi:hypothetical protein